MDRERIHCQAMGCSRPKVRCLFIVPQVDIPLSGIISIERANAYGIELHNVNFTCASTHGDVMDADFQLGSPLTLTTGMRSPVENEPQEKGAMACLVGEHSSLGSLDCFVCSD